MLTTQEIQQVQKSVKDDPSTNENRLSFVFEALADATRLKIFQLLIKYKGLCVTDLANVCKLSVPAISYQLKIMEIVGLVKKERMGKMICYKVRENDSLVKRFVKIIR
ncbi:winged helix-turn-helix transcriptional regulator [Patescibacteria group bacterium]|nr:winged helix-turn-helix transcriptional regulator [Patescibacteria group bacterium]